MRHSSAVLEPGLARQGRRFRNPAGWFALIAVVLEVPGILLFALGHSWVAAVGIALIGLGAPPAVIAIGLLASAIVAGWAAHHRPFA